MTTYEELAAFAADLDQLRQAAGRLVARQSGQEFIQTALQIEALVIELFRAVDAAVDGRKAGADL